MQSKCHVVLSGVGVLAVLGGLAGTLYADGFWIGAGPVFRGGMKASVSGSSHVQGEGMHAATPSAPSVGDLIGVVPSARNTDRITQYADRSYDDGYVFMDGGTGNSLSIDPDGTWYWGYEDASQYDAGAGTLTFHRNGKLSGRVDRAGTEHVVSLATSQDGDFRASDTFEGWGAEIVVGYPYRKSTALQLDLCGGLVFMPNTKSRLRGATFAETVQEDTYSVRQSYSYTDWFTDTYVYDTTDVTIPAAPYNGTYDGPFGTPPVVPSPVIPNCPESTTRRTTRVDELQSSRTLTASSTWDAMNAIDISVDTDIYELWIGPRVAIQAANGLTAYVTPKISLSYADVSMRRSESFVAMYADGSSATLGSWYDTGSEKKLLLGAGASAGVDWVLQNGLFVGVWGGYDWVSDDVNVTVGANEVSVDLSGYMAGAAVGYRFGGR